MIQSQLASLQEIDVLVLNEADWGMKRTDYRDVAGELAAALHMNYVYGVELYGNWILFSSWVSNRFICQIRIRISVSSKTFMWTGSDTAASTAPLF